MKIPDTESLDYRIKILLVEDNENDVALVRRVLVKGGLDFLMESVDTADGVVSALEHFQPDIILSDYALPGYSGRDAINTVAALNPETPVIIVTGSLGDELAVDLIRSGAKDYLLKQNLMRLPGTVRRAVRERDEARRLARAEQELHRQRETMSHLFEYSMDGIVVIDARGTIVEANDAAGGILGAAADDLVGMRWSDLHAPDSSQIPLLPLDASTGDRRREYTVLSRLSGAPVEIEVAVSIERERGAFKFAYLIFRDVTKRRRMEKTIRKDRDFQRLMYSISREVSASSSDETVLEQLVHRIRDYSGYPHAHVLERDDEGVFQSSDIWIGELDERIKEYLEKTRDIVFVDGDGLVGRVLEEKQPRWIEDLAVDTTFIRSAAAQRAGFRTVFVLGVMAEGRAAAVVELYDVEPRKPDENFVQAMKTIGAELGRLYELREFQRRSRQWTLQLEALVHNAPETIVRVDPRGVVRLVNNRIATFGVNPEHAVGKSAREIGAMMGLDSDTVDKWLWAVETVRHYGSPIFLEWQTGDGSHERVIETNLVPEMNEYGEVGYVLTFSQDITERREAERSLRESEERLQHAQKLDSIGRLAGGIAHDFNNILTAMKGYLFLLKSEIPESEVIRRHVDAVDQATQRAERLTNQLLLFSKRAPSEMGEVDLDELITEMAKMLDRLIGEGIKLQTAPSRNGALVRGDIGKMEQIIMNLVINARDALPEGGIINVTTESDSGEGFVGLRVSDNGVGMEESVLKRIFEPFYTTKSREKGTGLGLAVVQGIVEEHGGRIRVESSPGVGTTFELAFPTTQGAVVLPKATDLADTPPRGKGHVLVVEDDAAIGPMVVEALSTAGFVATLVTTYSEAIAALGGIETFDIVLSDVALPDGSGAELLDHKQNGLPFVFASGYLENRQDLDKIRESGYTFVRKPYDLVKLTTILSEVLERQK